MADFPDMKFILVGDDGQKDPTTYATIARRYPDVYWRSSFVS